MIYFKMYEGVIGKYHVSFDKKKIEELKTNIINNCSYIKHRELESDYRPRFTEEIIRHFKCEETKKKKVYFEETRSVYLYKYDEYIPPYLVKLIDKLLNGVVNALDGILSYDIGSSFKEQIDKKIKEVNQELNKNQHSITTYYKELLELIDIKLIETLQVSELSKIENFFEVELFSKGKVKVLKK